MHDQPLPVVVALLCSDTNTGLPRQTAEERLAHHGRIVLRAAKTTPWWIRLAAQFQNLMIGLLVTAAIIAGLLGDWIDTAAILAIVVINAVLGFAQEQRAERAMGSLSRLSAPQAKVKRDGVIAVSPYGTAKL